MKNNEKNTFSVIHLPEKAYQTVKTAILATNGEKGLIWANMTSSVQEDTKYVKLFSKMF